MKQQLFFASLFAVSFYTANAQKAKPEDTEFYTPVVKVITPGQSVGAFARARVCAAVGDHVGG